MNDGVISQKGEKRVKELHLAWLFKKKKTPDHVCLCMRFYWQVIKGHFTSFSELPSCTRWPVFVAISQKLQENIKIILLKWCLLQLLQFIFLQVLLNQTLQVTLFASYGSVVMLCA